MLQVGSRHPRILGLCTSVSGNELLLHALAGGVVVVDRAFG